MKPPTINKLVLCLALFTACSKGGDSTNPNINNPDVDLATPGGMTGGDGGMSGGDGGGGKPDMTVVVGLPCIPGSYRCGTGNAVEICNSSGTAWLYSATCTVSCTAGLCTGACTPGEKRCNGKNVETCNTTGSAYGLTESCTTFCEDARCAIASLDVATNKTLDGDQLVDGDIIIRSGATLTSPAGDLTLRTRGAIMVETGASIVVNPTGMSSTGAGRAGGNYYGGSGGGYGTAGSSGQYSGGYSWGATTDVLVQAGSPGGSGATYGGPTPGGNGGGVLRLMARKSITLAGQVTANGASGATNPSGYGGGGGGSGGGILIATPEKITISGSISANGGGAGTGGYTAGPGGLGRVKVLNSGSTTVTGTITATLTQGLLPPTTLSSSSHPSTALTYNDGFPSLSMSWNQAFSGLQGYYYKVSQNESDPPTPASGGKVVMTESINITANEVRTGQNWFHIVPIDAMSNVGTVENIYSININSTPLSLSSSDHPSPGTWYPSGDVYYVWTFPVDEKNFKGAYYVLDHYGDTMPTSTGTFIPVTQKKLLRAGLANGVWVMHMVSVDQHDYLTKTGSHFRVNVGPDPGVGTILGQVVDMMGKPVPNAKVTINRGLWTMTTNSMGSYNFMTQVPAGITWEIRATSADGLLADIKMDKVDKDGTTTVNLTLK